GHCRWSGYAAFALCFVAVVCSATAWWLWLTEWVPAGYPNHDPAANGQVDLWLARADYSYLVAFAGAAVSVVASAISARSELGQWRTASASVRGRSSRSNQG